MKTGFSFFHAFYFPSTIQLAGVLTWIVLLFTSPKVTAQHYYKATGSPNKGHWQLSTDYATNCTTIRFYNEANQVVYQETVTGQYIKPTKRNVHQIEQSFDRFMKGNLVLAQVKPSVLSESHANAGYQGAASTYNKMEAAPLTEKASSNLQVTLYALTNQSGFRLLFINARHDAVRIRLKNQLEEVSYSDIIPKAYQYSRKFIFDEGLRDGIYSFEVTNGKQQWVRRVQVTTTASGDRQATVIVDPAPLAGNLP